MKVENSYSLDHLSIMITSAQIRADRGFLKWMQGLLVSRAAVSVVNFNVIESDQVSPHNHTLDAIRGVLAGEGIRFVGDEAGGFGVMLRPRVS